MSVANSMTVLSGSAVGASQPLLCVLQEVPGNRHATISCTHQAMQTVQSASRLEVQVSAQEPMNQYRTAYNITSRLPHASNIELTTHLYALS